MTEKHLVCQGAACMCKFGTTPDKLKVLSNRKGYINDADGAEKLIATTLELGTTFEKNSFGACSKLQGNPCSASVIEWKSAYEKVTLANGGYPLLEDSTATCPIGGPQCIQITFHGQTAVVTEQNMDNAEDDTLKSLYPFGNLKDTEAGLMISNDQ